MKKSFAQFYQQEYATQMVPELAQQKISTKLFGNGATVSKSKWETIFSLPTLLVSTGALAIVVLGVYFSRQSLQPVQTALNNVKHELVDPKAALAQAIDNTFDFSNDTQFRYQKIRFERLQGTDSPLTNTMAI